MSITALVNLINYVELKFSSNICVRQTFVLTGTVHSTSKFP